MDYRFYCIICSEYYKSLGREGDNKWAQPDQGRYCILVDTVKRHLKCQITVPGIKPNTKSKKYTDKGGGVSMHEHAIQGLADGKKSRQLVLGDAPDVRANVKSSITASGMVTHFLSEHRLPYNLSEVIQ